MIRSIFIVAISLLFFACGNSKKSAENQQLGENSYRLIVSFISRGSGPDQKARQLFSDYLLEFETKNKLKITYDKYPWGKEGETDYCFKLAELKKDKQIQFIDDLKNRLSASDRVLYEENSECRHKR